MYFLKWHLMTNRDRFIKLTEQRVNRAIKQLDLIGNLSNKSNYSYSEEDVRKIFKVLNGKLKEVEHRFEQSISSNKKEQFRL